MFRSLGHDVQVEAKANEIYMYEYKLGRENGNDKICKSSLINRKQHNSVFNYDAKNWI